MIRALRRGLRISLAFIRMGWLLEISYPLGFALTQLVVLVPLFTYYFVERLVGTGGGQVGSDYFTFVVIGIVVTRWMNVGLQDLGSKVDDAMREGRFEMLLMTPMRWRLLPFALVQWPLLERSVVVVNLVLLSILMGADFLVAGVPEALFILALGFAATLAIGILAMSVKVLSKRADPVVVVYVLASQVLSGTFFPLNLLPGPLLVISYLMPHTYVVSSVRQLVMPGGGVIRGPAPSTAIVALSCFCVVVYPVGLWALNRAMNVARRLGILGSY